MVARLNDGYPLSWWWGEFYRILKFSTVKNPHTSHSAGKSQYLQPKPERGFCYVVSAAIMAGFVREDLDKGMNRGVPK